MMISWRPELWDSENIVPERCSGPYGSWTVGEKKGWVEEDFIKDVYSYVVARLEWEHFEGCKMMTCLRRTRLPEKSVRCLQMVLVMKSCKLTSGSVRDDCPRKQFDVCCLPVTRQCLPHGWVTASPKLTARRAAPKHGYLARVPN